MPSLSPVTLAALIIVVLAIVGIVIAYVRSASMFKGYEDVAGDAREIARKLGGEIFRDGGDLVISGNYSKLPSVVRFSYDENTPGLNIRMRAPATFSLAVAPRGASEAAEGRVVVRSGDEMFDARFTARTDQPNQVKMLISSRQTLKTLEKLCCSSKTFFTMSRGAMELSELVIPSPYTAHHVLDHVAGMGKVGAALIAMPGGSEIKIEPLRKEHSSPILRIAVAVGAIAAVVAVVSASRSPQGSADGTEVQAAATAPTGVLPVDMPLIPNLKDWRAARAEDFDPGAAAWLRGGGREPVGRVVGDFSGSGRGQDVAYLLVRADGTRRLVLLVNRENRYDANYSYIGLIARVPGSSAEAIKWVGSPPQGHDGDGLLITRKPDDLASGLAFFTSGGRVATGVPANYQNIPLE